MRIKKHSNGNQYLLTPQGKWVRNFTLPASAGPYLDLNSTIDPKDHFTFLKNEVQNGYGRYPWIDSENFYHPKVVVVSDGHDFKRKHKLLASLPKDVTIIGVNGALAKWEVPTRSLNFYVVNNPYPECMKYLPRRGRSFPRCIASPRTNFEFLTNYRGGKFRYYPVNEAGYSTLGLREVKWQVDDYRNPVCAAIGLAYRWGVERLLLFCCDDTFEGERPGAEKLENGLWTYPQHHIASGLIDGNLYWLTHQPHYETIAADCSSGPRYENAVYIDEDSILSFFGVQTNDKKD
jgi:hypothetical protein